MIDKIKTLPIDRKNLIIRIFLSILLAALVFSAGSFIVAVPVYLLVPIFAAFIVASLVREKKISAITAILLAGLGSIIFSNPPGISSANTPDGIILTLVAQRQAQLLRFSPPLLQGLLGGILGWGIARLVIEKKKFEKFVVWAIFILICVNFVWISMDLNPGAIQKSTEEPLEGAYNNYNSLNIKTFYLMKSKLGFYRAYSKAFSSKADSFGKTPGSLLGCLITLYFAFDIARRYVEPTLSLVAPVLMVPLFVYGASAFWFTFPEFWGLFFLMMGVWGIHKNNKIIAVIGFSIAPLIRSIFIVSWVGALIPAFFRKDKKESLYMLIPGLVFILGFALHYRAIAGISGVLIPSPGQWLQGTIYHFLATYKFSAALLSRPGPILHLLLILFIASIFILGRNYQARILIGCAIMPIILSLKLGTTSFRGYWGIIYLPFLLLAVSLLPYCLSEKKVEIFPERKGDTT